MTGFKKWQKRVYVDDKYTLITKQNINLVPNFLFLDKTGL